ncbi:MAG: hypothetical protein BWX92_03351 [Deltaproteobacteria bacterium ADurb.Bin135]|nr:MAG: hypothetical protein BWX92_03351 [Deltaproteobacteria bacterium ADurb.Bin135]
MPLLGCCDGPDELTQLIPVSRRVRVIEELVMHKHKIRVLVGGIPKDRSIIFFKLLLQIPHGGIVGENTGNGVEVLAGMFDRSVLFDHVMGELEDDALVRLSPFVEGNRHHGCLEIDVMQGVGPCIHFRLHADLIKVNRGFFVFHLFHLEPLSLRSRQPHGASWDWINIVLFKILQLDLARADVRILLSRSPQFQYARLIEVTVRPFQDFFPAFLEAALQP